MENSQNTNPFNDFVFIDATPAERGTFTLATDKALAKLKKFQLPDPTYFILQWIQAIVASGAQTIDIRYNHGGLRGEFELQIAFDGPGYSKAEIDGLYDHVFKSGRDRKLDRLRELALGWLSASSLSVSKIELDSNQRKRKRSKGDSTADESTESAPGPGSDSPKSSLPHRLVVAGKGDYPFEEILGRRCVEVPCQLLFNRKVLSATTGPAGVPWPNKPFQNGPTRGVLGATYGGSATSQVAFLRHGVEFVSRTEPSLNPPVIARVVDDTLSKNVSQTDVVRDEAYEDFLGRIRSEMKTLGLELTKKRIPSYQREALNRFIQSYLKSYIDVRVFDDPNRLKLLGEEFANLVEFPLFRVTGTSYISLQDLKKEYDRNGYLVYSLDERSQLARWDGTLLFLEIEEVGVLSKFFSNLVALSWQEVKELGGWLGREKLSASRTRPVAVSVSHRISDKQSMELELAVPDTYPNGKSIVYTAGATSGQLLPGASITLTIKAPEKPNSNRLANLRRALIKPVTQLTKRLSAKLCDDDDTRSQSRARYAELVCEQLIFLFKENLMQKSMSTIVDELGTTVRNAPILGLEDGSLVSINDLRTYLKHTGVVYIGGVFKDGIESGALDPMPQATSLLRELLDQGQMVWTDNIRADLTNQPDVLFAIRRQTLMRGLAANPSPAQTLKNFATEAEREAAELAALEEEYRAALEGPELFVAPDSQRLQELAEMTDQESFASAGLEDTVEPEQAVDKVPTQSHDGPDKLPTLDEDLRALRVELKDFCASPRAVHVEFRERMYSFHLSTRWIDQGESEVYLLEQDRITKLSHKLPIEGFLRVSPLADLSARELLEEGVEQLLLKALHNFRREPLEKHQRKRMRAWLLRSCQLLPDWRKVNSNIASGLTDAALVPCLGGRVLSWRQLRSQASRLEYTLVCQPGLKDVPPDPTRDVIALKDPWLDEILTSLSFPPKKSWSGEARSKDFDLLLRSAWKELLNVQSGTEAHLIRPDVVKKLSGDSSFWTKWRAGFLSWDNKDGSALINPAHKLAKKLVKGYAGDPKWASILASALFSTINRGLEEVEDRHERVFLEGLLSTLE